MCVCVRTHTCVHMNLRTHVWRLWCECACGAAARGPPGGAPTGLSQVWCLRAGLGGEPGLSQHPTVAATTTSSSFVGGVADAVVVW